VTARPKDDRERYEVVIAIPDCRGAKFLDESARSG
jgi:hypothetical protein